VVNDGYFEAPGEEMREYGICAGDVDIVSDEEEFPWQLRSFHGHDSNPILAFYPRAEGIKSQTKQMRYVFSKTNIVIEKINGKT
jgi:hypothetical protein